MGSMWVKQGELLITYIWNLFRYYFDFFSWEMHHGLTEVTETEQKFH